jgi:uracil-DNA glycosylase family 4
MLEPEPPHGCQRCPRLAAYRTENAAAEPLWFNGPAPSFGDSHARLLIVGLAPGRSGANRTGRPFTGDYAGDLLYATLLTLNLAQGRYAARTDDGLLLQGVMITNAVRCAPPQNKPTPEEAAQCLPFLRARIEALPQLRALLALGAIAHAAVLRAHGLKPSRHPFGHERETLLPGGRMLVGSYHCSRYNTNTGKLTPEMFESAVRRAWRAAQQATP